jgi:hypothetical protein
MRNTSLLSHTVAAALTLLSATGCPGAPEFTPKGTITTVTPAVTAELPIDLVLDADQSNWEDITDAALLEAAGGTDNALLHVVVESLVRTGKRCEAVNFIRAHFHIEPIVCPAAR